MLKQKSSVPPCSRYCEQALNIYSLRRPGEPTVRHLPLRTYHSKMKATEVVFSRAEVRLMVERDTKNAASAAFNLNGGAGSRTRTYELRRGEIYSLLRLPLRDSSSYPNYNKNT